MLWAILIAAAIADDKPAETPHAPDIHVVRQALAGEQAAKLKSLRQELETAKQRQKNIPRDRNRKKALAESKQKIDALTQKIERLETGKDDPPIPSFSQGKRHAVGSFGMIDGPSTEIKVIAIVSPNECVGYWTYYETHLTMSGGYSIEHQVETPFFVRGVETKDFAEGSRFPLRGCYRISGRSNWRGKTLFVLEPFDVRGFVAQHENDAVK